MFGDQLRYLMVFILPDQELPIINILYGWSEFVADLD